VLYGGSINPVKPLAATLVSGTTYQATLTGLTGNTTHYFKSVASNTAGTQTSAVSAGITTQGPGGPPSVPAFVSATDTSISVTTDVTGVGGTPTPSYPIGWRIAPPAPGSFVYVSTTNVGGNIWGATISSLVSSANYVFQAAADNIYGANYSDISPPYSTLALPPIPVGPNQAPTIPAFVPGSAGVSSLSVTFDVAGITGTPPPTYSTLYRVGTNPKIFANAVLSTGTTYITTLSSLLLSTNYTFQSRAGNATGFSTSLASAPFSTLAGLPGGLNQAPTIPALVPSSASISSLSVTFDVAGITGAPPINFSTFWGTGPNPNTPADAVLSSGTIYQTTLTGLSTYTNYYIESVASNPIGISTSVDSVVSTLAIPPSGPPTIPALITATSTSLLVSFDAAGITGTPTPTYITEWGPSEVDLASATTTLSTGTIYTANIPNSPEVLVPATGYFVRSRAFNVAGTEPSAFIVMSTLGGNGNIAPGNLPFPFLVDATPSSMTLGIDVSQAIGTPPITWTTLGGNTAVPADGGCLPGLYTLSTGSIYTAVVSTINNSPLAPSTLYYFRTTATNAYGGGSIPVGAGPFSTLALPPVAPSGPPTIPVLVPESVSTTTLSVTFDVAGITGNPPPTYSTLYGTTTSPTTPANAVLSTGTIYRTDLTNLSSGINYYFLSLAGNATAISTSDVSVAYSTISSPLSSSPTIPVLQDATTSSITWTFDTAGITGTGPITYGIYINAGLVPGTFSTGTIYSATATGLSQYVDYICQSYASNPGGTLSSLASDTSQTLSPPTQLVFGIYLPAGPSTITILSPAPTHIGNPIASTFITYALSTTGGFTAFSTPSVSTNSGYFASVDGLLPSTTYNFGTLISNPLSTISVLFGPITTDP
jgi:hypothetical protein